MIVTLLTDFGHSDPYVGVMKGVLLGADPAVPLVDLSHGIAPGDVDSAAYALLVSYPFFPAGTVHLAVVDPGVGTSRRALAAEAAGQRFVAPDNGLLSFVLEREPGARVVEVTETSFFREPRSHTFHGRDLFAPVAAALAGGTLLDALGAPVSDAVRLASLEPRLDADGVLRGRVLAIDRFGNCITSIGADALPEGVAFRLELRGEAIAEMRGTFADGSGPGPFVIPGSAGFLEVAVNGGSAAERLRARVGDPVALRRGG